jgi:hypothetical protein
MRESFWNVVFTAHEAEAMAEKYAWLRREVLEAEGPVSSSALREAARRWPGALRECQRVEPERYRAREQWAREGALSHDRARAAWLAEGRAAVCLWSELHQLVADVLVWRAGLGRRARGVVGRADPVDFLRDLTPRDPERRAAWPEAEVLGALGSGGVGPGLAEACLAHWAGWDRSTLRACLLGLDPA